MTRERSHVRAFPERLIARLLCCDVVPRHVAVIMDGNRRYALRSGCNVEEGHGEGAKALDAVARATFDLGCEILSVYALSTENFKRSPGELRALFDLVRQKLTTLASSEVVKKYDARVHVSGDVEALPSDVREAARDAMRATWTGRGPMLNVCLAYTGREDIARALISVNEGVRSGEHLRASDVDEGVVGRCLHGGERFADGMPEVDLLVRTSGESRLSDYMLYNARFATIVFVDALWPDFTFMDMARAVWKYQRAAGRVKLAREAYARARAMGVDEEHVLSNAVAEVSIDGDDDDDDDAKSRRRDAAEEALASSRRRAEAFESARIERIRREIFGKDD